MENRLMPLMLFPCLLFFPFAHLWNVGVVQSLAKLRCGSGEPATHISAIDNTRPCGPCQYMQFLQSRADIASHLCLVALQTPTHSPSLRSGTLGFWVPFLSALKSFLFGVPERSEETGKLGVPQSPNNPSAAFGSDFSFLIRKA